MVRIDVQAHHAHARFGGIGCATGAQGLGQHDRNPAVQDPVRLAGALVHWHAGTNEVIADFQKFHTEMARGGVDMAVGQKVDRDRQMDGNGLDRSARPHQDRPARSARRRRREVLKPQPPELRRDLSPVSIPLPWRPLPGSPEPPAPPPPAQASPEAQPRPVESGQDRSRDAA